MLDEIKREVDDTTYPTFNSRYIDYLLEVQDRSILLEMKYLKTHNTLDVLKLDRLISREFDRIQDDFG